MEIELRAVLIGLALAVVLGYFTARSSNRREKIYSGMTAQIFHYIGAGLFAATPPTVLLTLILGGEFLQAVVTGVGFLAVSYASLVVFATLERPLYEAEQRKKQERGWTEQDARSSGL